MSKKNLLNVLVFLVLIIVPNISAQEIRQESVGYQCLDFVHCSDGGPNDKNKRCEPTDDDKAHTSAHWGHRSQVDLSDLENLPVNSEILVTECLSADVDLDGDGKNDPICTTGDSKQDKKLFCGTENATSPTCDHFSILKEKLNYSLDRSPAITTHGIFYLINGVFQKSIGVPIKVGADGKPTVKAIEWEAHTPGNLTRKYLAWYYTPIASTPTPIVVTTTPGVTGGVGGQQQAKLNFEVKTPIPTLPPATVQDCKGKAWDPYGKVFDTKSLEPIPEARVLLKQRNAQNVFDSEFAKTENPLILNPFPTDKNGEYIFFVKDGDYSLEPSIAGYVHPSSTEQSSFLPNTLKVYSDLYFNNSSPILQRGVIQHRDIPLIPADGVGKEYPLEILYEDIELSADGKMIYSGKLSHPFAEVIIETCRKQNNIEACSNMQTFGRANGGADQLGNFTFTLDQTKLATGEYYKRSFRKVDLTTVTISNSFNFKKIVEQFFSLFTPGVVNAQEQTDTATIQPIVSYIEGFAYDTEGNIMPNARVLIKVPLSEVAVYQTTANQNGYYKITSESLPNTEYSIEYQLANASDKNFKITTSQLLEQNKAFIEAEKINPYLLTTRSTDPRKTVTPSYIPQAKISSVSNEFHTAPVVTNNNSAQQTQQTERNNFLLIGSILLLLIAAAGTMIGIYLYRKRTQEQVEI